MYVWRGQQQQQLGWVEGLTHSIRPAPTNKVATKLSCFSRPTRSFFFFFFFIGWRREKRERERELLLHNTGRYQVSNKGGEEEGGGEGRDFGGVISVVDSGIGFFFSFFLPYLRIDGGGGWWSSITCKNEAAWLRNGTRSPTGSVKSHRAPKTCVCVLRFSRDARTQS